MKKIFYLVFFISLCFLFNLNFVEGKNLSKICYYKTTDSKITFAVKAYDDGTAEAFLTQPYSKTDFGENQSYGASWKNLPSPLSGSSCLQYMKYNIKFGSNSFEFSSSRPESSNESYILTKYDFDSNASKCVYKGLQTLSSGYQITFNVLINDNAVFTYFNNDLDTAMDTEYKTKITLEYPTSYRYRIDSNFQSNFIQYFYSSSTKCPKLDITSYNNSIRFYPSDNITHSQFGIVDESYSDETDTDVILKNYQIDFYDQNIDTINEFFIRSYKSGKEEICVKYDGSLQCTTIDRNSNEILLFNANVNNKSLSFKIKKDQISNLFKYEQDGDYSTLIKPQNICFNGSKGDYFAEYYLSTDCTSNSIPAIEQNYKEKICTLKSIINNLDFDKSSYKLDFYESVGNNYNTYSIDSIPCDVWGYNYNYSCTDNTCSKETLYDDLESSLKSIQNYCLETTRTIDVNSQVSQNRADECFSFNKFYNRLVDEGIIRDLSQGCDILSDALKEKILWILNIIKIAGPLLALGLGTLDFIKVLANGDADKEMKTAFKRFSIRLGAAALLFIIPLILAFLLDIFLGNQDGYNSDNPFCIEIDWDE